MSTSDLTAAIVHQILSEVAPATADLLANRLPSATETPIRDMRHINVDDEEPVLLAMVAFALHRKAERQAKSHKEAPSGNGRTVEGEGKSPIGTAKLQQSIQHDNSTPQIAISKPSFSTGEEPVPQTIVAPAMVHEDLRSEPIKVAATAPDRPEAPPVAPPAAKASPEIEEMAVEDWNEDDDAAYGVSHASHSITSVGGQGAGAVPAHTPAGSVGGSVPTSTSTAPGAGAAAARQALAEAGIQCQTLPEETLTRLRLLLFGHGGSIDSGKAVPTRRFGPEWLQQGFCFSSLPGLQYMLQQHKGGPCGPLAAVNAEVARFLYYTHPALMQAGSCASAAILSSDADEDARCPSWACEAGSCSGGRRHRAWQPLDVEGGKPLDPTAARQQRALVLALTTILWRCRGDEAGPRPAKLALPTAVCTGGTSGASSAWGAGGAGPDAATRTVRVDGYTISLPADGCTDSLSVYTCATVSSLAAAVEAHLPFWLDGKGPGLACLVMSCLLTRGMGQVITGQEDAAAIHSGPDSVLLDVDPAAVPVIASSGLVGAYAYASQELVCLLVTGRASTNTFDGTRVLQEGGDKTVLHGVSCRSDVGFLSVFSAVGLAESGAHLTWPRAPVWVTFAESHYSFLFAAPTGCVWPQGAASKPKYTFGRQRTGPSYPASPTSERCVGLSAVQGPEERGLAGRPVAGQVLMDMVYADGLARQDELIRVTLSAPSSCWDAGRFKRLSDGEDSSQQLQAQAVHARDTELSSLELWAHAGWPGSKLHWNDTDPWEAMRLELKAPNRRKP